jgi:hypothetical protein
VQGRAPAEAARGTSLRACALQDASGNVEGPASPARISARQGTAERNGLSVGLRPPHRENPTLSRSQARPAGAMGERMPGGCPILWSACADQPVLGGRISDGLWHRIGPPGRTQSNPVMCAFALSLLYRLADGLRLGRCAMFAPLLKRGGLNVYVP